jgi:hypothetical protein
LREPTQPRFNLVFSGQLLPDTNPDRARRTLASFFGLRDPAAVAVFFSGKPVPLRRNLSRDDARRLYQQLRAVGLICEVAPLEKPATPGVTKKPKRPSHDPEPPIAVQMPGPQPPQRRAEAPATAQARGRAPNLFALRPVQGVAEHSQIGETLQIRGLIAAAIAAALCVLVLAVAWRFPAAPAGYEPRGPLALTTLPGNELILLLDAALLIHERSGLPRVRIAASEFGFEQLAPPLLSLADGRLLLNARSGPAPLQLHRCDIASRQCGAFPAEPVEAEIVGAASSFVSDSVFLLSADGSLIRSNTAAAIEARATVLLPGGEPRLLASDGLLLLPANEGPLLGIYRPDQKNFGQQLDALLLMPPSAVDSGQNRIRDIALTPEHRWALLDGDGVKAGLYRFDPQWGSPLEVSNALDAHTPYLQAWREKVLLADPGQLSVARFSAAGEPEAPFSSELLLQEREDWIRATGERALLRSVGIGLPLLIALIAGIAAALYFAAGRALNHLPQQRSALLDPMPAGIHWLPDADRREARVAKIGVMLLCLTLLPAAGFALTGNGPSALAMLPAIIASLYAWDALRRGCGGHLGILGSRIIAVDHDGRYFYGEQSALRGTPGFLLAPGIVLPLAIPGLRNLQLKLTAAERASIQPSRRSTLSELAGTLWLYRHPWMIAVLALCIGAIFSMAGLILAQS